MVVVAALGVGCGFYGVGEFEAELGTYIEAFIYKEVDAGEYVDAEAGLGAFAFEFVLIGYLLFFVVDNRLLGLFGPVVGECEFTAVVEVEATLVGEVLFEAEVDREHTGSAFAPYVLVVFGGCGLVAVYFETEAEADCGVVAEEVAALESGDFKHVVVVAEGVNLNFGCDVAF